ncbi:MAG: ABC transporter permease [Oscillospiraceae bacterium]|nr:ABC transporter permease [Oscillospiraceae bacterium]
MRISQRFTIIRTILAIAIALAVAIGIIFLVSKSPVEAIVYFITGPVKKFSRLMNVVEMMLPLLFTGLSLSLIQRTGVFNLASEGCFFIGGAVAGLFAVKLTLPKVIDPLVCILMGGLVGMLCMMIPAVCRLKFGASEVVSSLMMNYVLMYLGLIMIRVFVRNPDTGQLQSLDFQPQARLSVIIPGTRVHTGLIVAAVLVVVFWIYLFKSRWGYRMRMTGSNPGYSRYSGINNTKSILIGQALAGLACGIGGACEVLGLYQSFKWLALPGYGFDGVIIASLAQNNPILVPIGAFFLAYIRVGADIMTRMTDVQNEIVSIIQGVVIVLLSARAFLGTWEKREIVREATANAQGGEKA